MCVCMHAHTCMHARVCAFDMHIHLGGGDEGRDERQKERKAGRQRAAGGRKRRCRAHQSTCTHVSDVRASNTPSVRPLIELPCSRRSLGTRREAVSARFSPAHAPAVCISMHMHMHMSVCGCVCMRVLVLKAPA